MMHRGRMSPDPVVLNGPPNPDEFARITALEDSKRGQYAELYQRFMANTQAQRDSLKASFATMRESFEKGDREGARGQRSAVRDLRGRLVDQQKQFDETVKGLVSTDQWKKYEKWREDERERVKKEWRERRSRRA
jgi:hypothetical protein